ncbi:MAG: LacI family DNA-binding transcriptional regulator [Anaerolineae bacterium]|nr:LacI family DNA-binding transcriptional regulator [Anaerolineae bacterium]
MPTIKDVAREAGVSIATVSYVLNKKDTFVSQETRRQVLEAIERIGYTPNITARNLKSSRTRLIGYAWHEVPNDQVNPVLDRFTYYLAQAAEAAGYHILTFTHPTDDPLPVYNDMIRTQRVDAFVLAGTVRDDARIRFLQEADFPFVSFGRSNPDWDFPWVDTDGRQGVREATEYLIGLGHRRIGMAAWPEESISGSFRLQGYFDALDAADVPFDPAYLVRGKHSEQAGRDALAYWCSLPRDEQPTAIVAITDLVAIGIMNEAERRGIVIGRDLSLIGYDDVPMSQYLRPALTTVQQPILEIGQALMRLLQMVLIQNSSAAEHALISPRLIIRDSTGALCR